MQTKEYKSQDPLKVKQLMKLGHLGRLLSKVETLTALNAALYNFLPAPVRPYCQIINIDINTVVLGTQNSHIANTLYYQQNDILNALLKAIPDTHINNIRIRVSPHL